jgi:hypothetical protein
MADAIECLNVTAATKFPKLCVRCGSRRGTRRERYAFERLNPAVVVGYLAVFAALGPLWAMLAGARLRSVVTVELSRCKECRNRSIGETQQGAFAMIGAMVTLLGAGAVGFNGGSKVLTAALLTVTVAIVVIVTRAYRRSYATSLRALRQEGSGVWVAGIHPDVLAVFPDAQKSTVAA